MRKSLAGNIIFVKLQHCTAIFLVCCLGYFITGYYGIRSPDSEIVYRAGESLVNGDGLSVEPMEPWLPHGIAKGLDGRHYSIFGPAESIALYPFIKMAHRINLSDWYEDHPHLVQLSWYATSAEDIARWKKGKQMHELKPHADRQIVGMAFNVLVTALIAVVFWLTVFRMTGSATSSGLATLMLAFGTPLWHYSGTLFSEPLTILFVLASFYFLAANDENFGPTSCHHRLNLALSGLFMGVATDTHISAILFVPFIFAYAMRRRHMEGNVFSGEAMKDALFFAAPFALMLGLLLWYNYARFGDVFETGRRLGEQQTGIAYGHWAMPLQGLWGLIASPGKGLFLYAPVTLAGVLFFSFFYRRHKALSILLAAMVIFRILFIAARSDWHGGFCLGPRYLLMIVPFMLMPLGFVLMPKYGNTDRRLLYACIAIFVFASHQLYFNVGEVFEYFLATKLLGTVSMDIYFSWEHSPLLHLHKGVTGSYIIDALSDDNLSAWFWGSWLIGIFCWAVYGFYKNSAQKENRRA